MLYERQPGGYERGDRVYDRKPGGYERDDTFYDRKQAAYERKDVLYERPHIIHEKKAVLKVIFNDQQDSLSLFQIKSLSTPQCVVQPPRVSPGSPVLSHVLLQQLLQELSL
ncbi:hypothetical protein SAMN04244570_1035 [Sporosarcina newyorkensis]|uniref:Uncharacterized protein n=1 Tax=Sporosarcina newyorkensis TaxID=759851 RepID=A0A1T4XP47_9BACL|nr:hypothetical protein SAMN04244570_1035 [Sporosarcina newyorkensis]